MPEPPSVRRSLLLFLCSGALAAAAGLASGSGTALVNLKILDPTFVIDARYATKDNFVGTKLYRDDRLFLLRSAAERLRKVQRSLREEGLGLKIYDAYRPLSVQKILWRKVPDERYVADPAKGSMHNRGCAVDVTLVDSTGKELPMPTPYDDFTERAHRDFPDLPPELLKNRGKLERAMAAEGFIPFPTEWWHFDAPGCAKHPVLDIEP